MLASEIFNAGLAALTVLLSNAVIYLYVAKSGADQWAKRDILGAPLKGFTPAVFIAISCGVSFAAYYALGIFFAVAIGIVSLLLMISSATDFRSAKAPRELTSIGIISTTSLIAIEAIIAENSVGLWYLGAGVVTWALLWATLRIVARNSFGMADVRVLGLLSLFSYWLTPLILLTAVLIASPLQAVFRLIYKRRSPATGNQFPFIPALTLSAFVSVPVVIFVLL